MRRNILVFAALCIVCVLTAGVWGEDPAPASDPTEGATYIGEKSCKKCHLRDHRAWGKTPHAKAWDNLPEKYRDPSQKDDDGRACISCHVTGWGKGDRDGFVDATQSEHLLGVQCEVCHGPGSKHKEAAEKVMAEKRKSFNEGEKTFIVKAQGNCLDCHNPHFSYKDKYGEK